MRYINESLLIDIEAADLDEVYNLVCQQLGEDPLSFDLVLDGYVNEDNQYLYTVTVHTEKGDCWCGCRDFKVTKRNKYTEPA
jgi:hypothetical protein